MASEEKRRWLASVMMLSGVILLMTSGIAFAGPQYTMTCSSCHSMPPLDTAPTDTVKRNPDTGAFQGNHQTHASSTVASCSKCHTSTVMSYDAGHRNKQIELSDTLGYGRKSVGVFMNQTSVLPNPMPACSTAVCHSNGKGVTKATPAWGTVAVDCSTCHDAAPTSNGHTKHISSTTGYSYGCVKCHADHSVEAKPFQHATSAGQRNIDVRFTAAPNSGGTFAANQCSNIYCHSNGRGTTVAVSWNGSLDCKGCHGDATTGTLSGVHASHVNNALVLGTNYGCVDCHSTTVSNNTTVSDKVKHVDGSKDVSGARVGALVAGSCSNTYCHSNGKGTYVPVAWATGTLDCAGCHGTAGTFGAPAYTSGAAGSLTANSHVKHVKAAADCANCHSKTTTTAGTAIIANSQHTDGFINYTSGNGKTFGRQANKTCSNISCHSGNGIVANVPNAQWGATLTCAGCHGDSSTINTNAHSKHLTMGYTCASCHSGTASNNTTLAAGVLHMNNAADVSGTGLTYTNPTTTKNCTTSCHMTATPSWTNTASGACGTCHKAYSDTTNGLIATNAHTAHFTAAYGPGMNGATVGNACATCHVYTTDTASTHANGTVNLAAGYSANGTCLNCHKQTTNWAGGRVTCQSCHTGVLSVIGGITAPDKSLAATAGHGKAGIAQDCTACHSNTATHISGVLNDNDRLLPALGTGNTNCNYCHDDVAKVVDPNQQKMKAHRSAGLGSLCADCHDPHGTANSMMVSSAISGTTENGAVINATGISYTGTSTFANAGQNGICQVCHSYDANSVTGVKYFTKSGTTPQQHVDSTQNCLDCHKHNPSTGLAFTVSGSCDTCHGYPPAPRVVNTAVTFGRQGQWSSARFEDYSGGGGAHVVAAHISKTVKATDGWAPCLVCHTDGPNKHSMVMPMRNNIQNVTVNVDSKYRFRSDKFVTYTSAKFLNNGSNKTGRCFNVDCHFKTTDKWSIER